MAINHCHLHFLFRLEFILAYATNGANAIVTEYGDDAGEDDVKFVTDRSASKKAAEDAASDDASAENE